MWCCFFNNKRLLEIAKLAKSSCHIGRRLSQGLIDGFRSDGVQTFVPLTKSARDHEIVTSHDCSILECFPTTTEHISTSDTMLLRRNLEKVSTMIRLHPRDHKLSWTLMTSFTAGSPGRLSQRYLPRVRESLVLSQHQHPFFFLASDSLFSSPIQLKSTSSASIWERCFYHVPNLHVAFWRQTKEDDEREKMSFW